MGTEYKIDKIILTEHTNYKSPLRNGRWDMEITGTFNFGHSFGKSPRECIEVAAKNMRGHITTDSSVQIEVLQQDIHKDPKKYDCPPLLVGYLLGTDCGTLEYQQIDHLIYDHLRERMKDKCPEYVHLWSPDE